LGLDLAALHLLAGVVAHRVIPLFRRFDSLFGRRFLNASRPRWQPVPLPINFAVLPLFGGLIPLNGDQNSTVPQRSNRPAGVFLLGRWQGKRFPCQASQFGLA
jgi:hypothetical protein